MFKKLLLGTTLAVAVLGLAGTSMAVNYEVNLYGASAQYLYWNDAADDFLRNAKGCTSVVQAQDSTRRHGITEGTSCTAGHTYKIRYSSKASYDGILALKGDKSQAGSGDTCNDGEAVCGGGTVPAGESGFYRKMTCNQSQPETRQCVRVNLAASDVAGEVFTQESHGNANGEDGGAWLDRSFSGISTSGLTGRQPLIVPFGFFANNCITTTKCVSPDPTEPTASAHKAISSWGNQCYDPDGDGKSADCIGYYKCINRQCAGGVNAGQACDQVTDCPDVVLGNTQCKRIPIDNVSKLMVTLIYSGNALAWQDFGAWWDGDCNAETTFDPIYACMRHAGSGTQATFDIMMRGNGSYGLAPALTQTTGGPEIWFNDGSTQMMNCIAGKVGSTYHNKGAIGFADCDQLAGTTASGSANFPYEKVHAVKLDGVECKRAQIRNGEYPFWSANWNFWVTGHANEGLFGELIAFASNPNNLPAAKRDYWATAGEMVYFKSSDTAWPVYVGAANPQLP
ncbi:MAG: hypothetical protein A4E57_00647 [Syntrophorhabdaceae bacterium PtaU1.Bin034]|nr:MAG: hypothetical protein A4E57_00647 [Syntrophorhabdaceae bacterium PtaU1.Bin034]